jgi:hypothetical protein
MDFFGNVQNVEVEGTASGNESEWKEDLVQLGKMLEAAKKRENRTKTDHDQAKEGSAASTAQHAAKSRGHAGAVKVEAEQGWGQKVLGATVLLGCAAVWAAGSWYESPR